MPGVGSVWPLRGTEQFKSAPKTACESHSIELQSWLRRTELEWVPHRISSERLWITRQEVYRSLTNSREVLWSSAWCRYNRGDIGHIRQRAGDNLSNINEDSTTIWRPNCTSEVSFGRGACTGSGSSRWSTQYNPRKTTGISQRCGSPWQSLSRSQQEMAAAYTYKRFTSQASNQSALNETVVYQYIQKVNATHQWEHFRPL